MILLDANAVLWWLAGDVRLGKKARAMLATADTPLAVSLLTLFEVELKVQAGKLRLGRDLNDFLDTYDVGVYSPASRELSDVLSVPTGHGDPFDRALIGLAKLKGWDVLTSDQQLLGLHLPIHVIDSTK